MGKKISNRKQSRKTRGRRSRGRRNVSRRISGGKFSIVKIQKSPIKPGQVQPTTIYGEEDHKVDQDIVIKPTPVGTQTPTKEHLEKVFPLNGYKPTSNQNTVNPLTIR